jgi:NADH-quinone oxidoreductase subunit F
MDLTTLQLNKIGEEFRKRASATDRRVIVCAGTGCLVNGSLKVYQEFVQSARAAGLNAIVELKTEEAGVFVSKSGCQGFCQMGPLVTILPEGIFYTRVKPADVAEIVEATLKKGETVERLLYTEPDTGHVCRSVEEIPFYNRQRRFVLGKCGLVDPENIEEYIAEGGYAAATAACIDMTPEEI